MERAVAACEEDLAAVGRPGRAIVLDPDGAIRSMPVPSAFITYKAVV